MEQGSRCEHGLESGRRWPTCVKCGAPCCLSCARVLAAATYCQDCAESILEAVESPRRAPADSGASWSPCDRLDSSLAGRPGGTAQWIVLVARDQPDLLAHLARAFARDRKVEIIMDRRRDYRRNPPGMEDRLRTHGAAVIRRSPG